MMQCYAMHGDSLIYLFVCFTQYLLLFVCFTQDFAFKELISSIIAIWNHKVIIEIYL
jgi:hypothetical protein